MSAFIWNANPEKWNVVSPATSSWDALRDYVTDPTRYVYWSTRALWTKIQAGSRAYIWRTKFQNHPNGIIATGLVAEHPKDLSAGIQQFARPDRIIAAGWNESMAPSSWKTGIQLDWVDWNAPITVAIKPQQGTNRTLTTDEVELIEQNLHARGYSRPSA
jgi:hypothetical protein